MDGVITYDARHGASIHNVIIHILGLANTSCRIVETKFNDVLLSTELGDYQDIVDYYWKNMNDNQTKGG